MSNAKVVFRKLAFETHPDQGGSAKDFREVIKVKTDFDALVSLANRWGIKIDGIPTGNYREVLEAVIGAIVRHGFTYKRKGTALYGVIVNIRKVTRGYRKGANEFKVFDLESGQIWTLKTYEKQPFQEVIAMADLSQLEAGQQKVKNMKKYQKAISDSKQDLANQHFRRVGLVRSKSYAGKSVRVQVEYKGGKLRWEDLIRTTPKSVYVYCSGYKNNQRRIPVSSVIRKKMVY